MRRALVVGALFFITGCGGGQPLLYPARVLSPGDVRAAAGVSANIVPGSLANDLSNARANVAAGPGLPGTNQTYAKGALVEAAMAPGLAPFVSARVGLGHDFEGGLGYTGRDVRADMRHAWSSGQWSYSAGLGGSAVLLGREQGSTLPNVDLNSLHGYGLDVPLLAGWESAASIYQVWFGPRGGFEHVNVEELTTEPASAPSSAKLIDLHANRFYAGGVIGFAVGFKHIHVAIELDAAYQVATGAYNGNNVTISGVSISPATALWFTFD